eukprot:12143254-Alexandrium_andersonii.AAC.1
MATSAEAECLWARGLEVAISTFDLFKCYDQLPRPVIYGIMAVAGAPIGMLTAYSGMPQSLQVMGVYSLGVGAAKRR